MNTSINLSSLFTSLLIFLAAIHLSGQQNIADIEGHAKIRGNIDISHMEDSTAIIIGRDAGINLDVSSSTMNTFVGIGAGEQNLLARDNSFFGFEAGNQNTDGNGNSFFGRQAGYQNVNGGFNSFFGSEAGENNVGGGSNSFFGYRSGEKNTTGNSNSFFGSRAGNENIGGTWNSFFGAGSGKNSKNGGSNSFFGYESGIDNISGSNNTFIGFRAARDNRSGTGNVSIGYLSALGDTLMFTSVYLGALSGASFDATEFARQGNIFIGYESGLGEIHSNRLYIESSDADSSNALIYGRFDTDELIFNADVGIGTTNPKAQLEVNGNSSGNDPHLLLYETSEDDFARMRFENESSNGVYWGLVGKPKLPGNQSNALFNFFYSDTTFNVLQLFGDGDATLKGTLTENSDLRLKENVIKLGSTIEQLAQISGYRYKWKNGINRRDQIGLIAQEVRAIFPELVRQSEDGILSISYSKFVPILIEGLKEMVEISKVQEQEVINLKDENADLNNRLAIVEQELKEIKLMFLNRKE